MHINYRRGEDRVFVGLREGGPGSCSFAHRNIRSSFADEKREAWGRRRMREREAIGRGREMPRWRRTIRYDWL